MIATASPLVRRQRLAAELRGIREGKGESGDTVAAALRWSASKISRYERARTGLRPGEVARLLDYYQVTGSQREALLGLAEDAARKGWWEQFADSISDDYKHFIGLEHEAASVSAWHVDVVPGLLQTQGYARHIIASYSRIEPVPPAMIERLVTVRMRRQQVLSRPGFRLSVVLDESVLRRRIGDEAVMCEQLQSLARAAQRPNVTVQVLPLRAQHAVFTESFVTFGFGADRDDAPRDAARDVVCAEHLRNSSTSEDERETFLHKIAFQVLADSALDPAASRALILDAAQSYWPAVRRSA